jgi:hypothetical protein
MKPMARSLMVLVRLHGVTILCMYADRDVRSSCLRSHTPVLTLGSSQTLASSTDCLQCLPWFAF